MRVEFVQAVHVIGDPRKLAFLSSQLSSSSDLRARALEEQHAGERLDRATAWPRQKIFQT